MLRHVLRLPQQAPWTGQPRRTTGLEWQGFFGDTWAALRAGLRTALRAGLRAAPRVYMGRTTSRTADRAKSRNTDRTTRRAAWPRYAPGRRAALRTGAGPGCAVRRAADRAARQTNYSVTAPLEQRTEDANVKLCALDASDLAEIWAAH